MSVILKIHPAPFSGTSRTEQIRRAKALADDLKKIEGVESAEFREPLEKVVGIQNTLDPVITAAIINASGVVLAATVHGIFTLLRDKRNKRDHRATVINIEKTWFNIENDDEAITETSVVEALEEEFSKKKKKPKKP